VAWVAVDPYHAVNGSWTLAITGKDEGKRFSLFDKPNTLPATQAVGIFKTQKEAMKKFKELTSGS